MNLRERLAKNIMDRRKNVGLSQETLARRAGIRSRLNECPVLEKRSCLLQSCGHCPKDISGEMKINPAAGQ